MTGALTTIIHDGRWHLDRLRQLSERPAPFAPGDPHFWDDPHISASMLAAHLDPTRDAASRRHTEIGQSVAWLLNILSVHPGNTLLDLGCGPGLYCEQFARAGMRVTGIDASRRSIAYARAHAATQDLAITYIYGDYLEMEQQEAFDAIVLIYGDLCTLAPEPRDHLLRTVHATLKEGGRFALDVTTPRRHADTADLNHWEVRDAGFWRPRPHLVLTRGFTYPEHDLALEQYVIVETDGATAVYRNWFQDYTYSSITNLLEGHGFRIAGVWGDLTGRPYNDTAEWIGVVAQKD